MLQRNRHEMEPVGLFVGSLLQSKAAIDKRLANETRVPRRVLNLFSANHTIDRHKWTDIRTSFTKVHVGGASEYIFLVKIVFCCKQVGIQGMFTYSAS